LILTTGSESAKQVVGAVVGVHKKYGEVVALAGVDLSLGSGEIVALLGPNGAGKTTMIEILLGLQKSDSGTVHLMSGSPAEAFRAGRVGAMLQSGTLLPQVTVRELIQLVASWFPRPLAVPDVLDHAGLTALASRRTETLSGGEAQRVKLAVALVSDPELLVLDEPTVAMDVKARRDFWRTQRRLVDQGRSLLFATHYLEEAETMADRVVVIAHGRVVADAPATELKSIIGTKEVRFSLPHADKAELAAIPGVLEARLRGDSAVLRCEHPDTALRAVIGRYPDAVDFEVVGAGLEEAFLSITGEAS
jgi:ABC-2 type transport system ATP-binding protein